MNRAQLIQTIRDKRSYLCVGLDTDPLLLPTSLKDKPDGVLLFNKQYDILGRNISLLQMPNGEILAIHLVNMRLLFFRS